MGMGEFFEMLMVVSFGISWPISIFKALKSGTAKGKSVIFSYFIWAGYLFGITSKFLRGSLTYVFVFYVINLVSVSVDIMLYYRNRKLDKKREEETGERYYGISCGQESV